MALQDPSNLLPRIDWETRDQVVRLAKAMAAKGYDLRIRSGLRTCAEQNAIYAQGRTAPGAVVTNAPGCLSWHVMGRAVDLDPVDPRTGAIVPVSSGAYAVAGQIWESMGGVWGGRITGLDDFGHFEWHPGHRIEEFCPSAANCGASQAMIATVAPPLSGSPWAIAFGVFLAVGAILYAKS